MIKGLSLSASLFALASVLACHGSDASGARDVNARRADDPVDIARVAPNDAGGAPSGVMANDTGVLSRGSADAGAPAGGQGCSQASDCESGSFCSFPLGACKGQGVCRKPTKMCPMIYKQVCGCDGQTYTNECVAARSKASVAHAGSCGDGGS